MVPLTTFGSVDNRSQRAHMEDAILDAEYSSEREWVPVRRGKKWRHAPPGTPLWERLPSELQEHIARFLAQKMLWQLCNLRTRSPGVRRLHSEDHVDQIENLVQVAPIFGRTLYTVYLLSVTPNRGFHHRAFANGLVRFAWEAHDFPLRAAQGLSHISVPWEGQNKLAVDVHRFQNVVLLRLRQIVRWGCEMSGSHYLPQHYLQEVCAAIFKGVHTGTLRWVHGMARKGCVDFLSAVVNAPWHGRTRKQESVVRVVISAAMRRSLDRPAGRNAK